jgi:2-polyprenyl-3-methyl-5-hydroxy-6-metoxy-1,4-benzoquinol methylase
MQLLQLLRGIVGGARAALGAAADGPVLMGSDGGEGFIERVDDGPLPVLRVFGWYSEPVLPDIELLLMSGRRLQPHVSARVRREDVHAAHGGELFSGFRLDFLVDAADQPVSLWVSGVARFVFRPERRNYGHIQPHYANLFTTDRVLGRDSIYGSGPPVDVSLEYKQFAEVASGHTLDFGCGNGDLIEYLLARGVDAEGLELDVARIRNALKRPVEDRVTLYEGGRRLPFADNAFDSIVSTEVIEHVPGMADYVPELARILKPGGRLAVTTPDITSIPSSFPANCVPWHLLEATHINFFTPRSLEALFSSHFELERLYCLGAGRVNDFFVPGSIGAVFRHVGSVSADG